LSEGMTKGVRAISLIKTKNVLRDASCKRPQLGLQF
jgi:hypothetical protein